MPTYVLISDVVLVLTRFVLSSSALVCLVPYFETEAVEVVSRSLKLLS